MNDIWIWITIFLIIQIGTKFGGPQIKLINSKIPQTMNPEKILILGDHGIGKTRVIKHICDSYKSPHTKAFSI